MNFKQRILKRIYSLLMFASGRKQVLVNNENAAPGLPVYDLTIELINGDVIKLEHYKGRKILFVNTASDCGYTRQYESLQKLWETKNDELVILAFPANDFKNQESKTNEEINRFCTSVYFLKFPISKKTGVLKSPEQHPIYRWLTEKRLNGWNDQEPSWNFSKYLVDEGGRLTHYFEAGIDPLGEEMEKALENKKEYS